MARGKHEKQRIIYQGREYRLVKAPLWDYIFRETLRSRLSHWWHEWVKRNIVDDAPEDDERHSAARYSTLAEVNARRGYPIDEPEESSNDD